MEEKMDAPMTGLGARNDGEFISFCHAARDDERQHGTMCADTWPAAFSRRRVVGADNQFNLGRGRFRPLRLARDLVNRFVGRSVDLRGQIGERIQHAVRRTISARRPGFDRIEAHTQKIGGLPVREAAYGAEQREKGHLGVVQIDPRTDHKSGFVRAVPALRRATSGDRQHAIQWCLQVGWGALAVDFRDIRAEHLGHRRRRHPVNRRFNIGFADLAGFRLARKSEGFDGKFKAVAGGDDHGLGPFASCSGSIPPRMPLYIHSTCIAVNSYFQEFEKK
jgi:hypothetical protein